MPQPWWQQVVVIKTRASNRIITGEITKYLTVNYGHITVWNYSTCLRRLGVRLDDVWFSYPRVTSSDTSESSSSLDDAGESHGGAVQVDSPIRLISPGVESTWLSTQLKGTSPFKVSGFRRRCRLNTSG